jgi:hypothetical protein
MSFSSFHPLPPENRQCFRDVGTLQEMALFQHALLLRVHGALALIDDAALCQKENDVIADRALCSRSLSQFAFGRCTFSQTKERGESRRMKLTLRFDSPLFWSPRIDVLQKQRCTGMHNNLTTDCVSASRCMGKTDNRLFNPNSVSHVCTETIKHYCATVPYMTMQLDSSSRFDNVSFDIPTTH